MLYVYFGGKLVATSLNEGTISEDTAANSSFNFGWNANPLDVYTVIVYSVKDDEIPFVNLLVVNVPDAQLHEGQIILKYISPESDTTLHVELYRQKRLITSAGENSRHKLSRIVTDATLVDMAIVHVVDELPSRSGGSVELLSQTVGGTRGRSKTIDDGEYFLDGGRGMSTKQKKWCRCLLDVSSKQGSVNPYAICTSSVGGPYQCADHYNYRRMPLEKLRAFASFEGLDVPENAIRDDILDAIREWKISEGKTMH